MAGLRSQLEEERRERDRLETKLAEATQSAETTQGSRLETANEWRREIEETEKRMMEKLEEEKRKRRKRCITFTGSNGQRGTTPSSVKYHMLENCRDEYDVNIIIAYRIGEAADLVDKGDLAIDGAIVVLDCLGNDARLTEKTPKLSPDQHVQKLDEF